METNKIIKELKFAKFIYNKNNKMFTLADKRNLDHITLNKTYSFAFMRFLIRIASRNWFRKQKRIIRGVINNE